MDSDLPDCSECHHSHYDHIGWRPEGDTRTFCRIVRCECKGYHPVFDSEAYKRECEIRWSNR